MQQIVMKLLQLTMQVASRVNPDFNGYFQMNTIDLRVIIRLTICNVLAPNGSTYLGMPWPCKRNVFSSEFQ